MSKWRLPTINELQGAFDYEKGKPKVARIVGGFVMNYDRAKSKRRRNV